VHFDLDQVDRAIDHVAATALAHPGGLTNYTQVLSAAGMPAGAAVADFMLAFHQRCAHRGLPPLDSLVVHAAGPRRDFPDHGYFAVNSLADPVSRATPIADKRDATTFWLHQIQTCRLWTSRSGRG
jgi:hypothetical protein